ncbi:DUF1289 domain-containing protein [Parvibium lacunae]|uniref:DUF1289 domain-containing protein n=1 Tax=Parvibium lacunae TaxID=1888893 RepID=A0A368L4Z3_9BURK|nr:DUF1289 domain-containing protein [Parvibium lacunae]RCS58585.1 DUF1289 domain-containing protein [Parvibium lacunae]
MIASPCRQICDIHPDTGWCVGCLRSLAEIAAWGSASESQRQQIWLQLTDRAQHPCHQSAVSAPLKSSL